MIGGARLSKRGLTKRTGDHSDTITAVAQSELCRIVTLAHTTTGVDLAVHAVVRPYTYGLSNSQLLLLSVKILIVAAITASINKLVCHSLLCTVYR